MRKYPFKHKFLKRYSLDFFNQFGYQNTKNKAALTVRFALRQKVRKIAARRKKIHKRKVLSILRRSRKKNRRAFAVFSVTDRARAKPKKSLSFGGLLLAYRKKVFTYYVPRLSRKALRKYVNRSNKRFSLSRLFECRLDALLLRSNFINTVLEAGIGFISIRSGSPYPRKGRNILSEFAPLRISGFPLLPLLLCAVLGLE